MSWLKQATINAQAPKVGVIDVLRAEMGGWEKPRDINTVHASDTTKPEFCPRHLALLVMHEQDKKDTYISTAMAATFAVGRMTAQLLTDDWLGKKAVGNWECERCGTQLTMVPRPSKAGCSSKYKDHRWEYREPRFVSQEFGISGSIDVLVDVGPKLIVTEVKILKAEDWESILTPQPEHRIRTSLYLKLISDSGSPYRDQINLHEARVLYISRGYGKKHPTHNEIIPFKEFLVARDDAALANILKRAKQFKIFRDGGDSPKNMPAGLCHHAMDKYAKNCTTCKACFSGNYPAQQEPIV